MTDSPHPLAPPPSTSSGQCIQPLPPPPAERDPPDGSLVPVRERRDGWTAARQRDFIEHLADHGCVKSAAAAVGMSEHSAHRLRRRPDAAAFDAAWLGAVQRSLDGAIETALDRAFNGTPRGRYWKGELIGEDRIYNDRMLIWLIEKGASVLGRAHDRRGEIARLAENLEAIGDAPGGGAPRFRVWSEEGCDTPLTDAPPPPGFAGYENRAFGKKGYERELTREERKAWAAKPEVAAAEDAQEAARRAFFGLGQENARDA